MLCEGDLVAVPVPILHHGQAGSSPDGNDPAQGPVGSSSSSTSTSTSSEKDYLLLPSREEFTLDLVQRA